MSYKWLAEYLGGVATNIQCEICGRVLEGRGYVVPHCDTPDFVADVSEED